MSASAAPSSIGTQAAHGAAWTIASSLGTRLIQTVGTLVLANLLGREITGEVSNASVLVLTAGTFTLLGVPNYLVTRKTGRDVAWHSTVIMAATGVVALLALLALSKPLSTLIKSPALGAYLPGLAAAALLMRMSVIPERLLQRELRFRTVSLVRTVGDLLFTAVSVVLVLVGVGGMSLIWGNLARSAIVLLLYAKALPLAEWLTPHPLSRRTSGEILGFGVPMAIAGVLGFIARWWDNLMISALFGAGVVGLYNQAYNLADIPATQVGEQVGDVLTPSMAHLDDERRKTVLVRSTSLLALIVFPMAVGLGAISHTLFKVLFRPDWASAAPMLTALSVLSIVRPIGWTIGSYLQITNRSHVIMWLSAARVVSLFAAIALLGTLFGPVAACLGAGVGFGVFAVGSLWVVVRGDGIPVSKFMGALGPPLLACAPLAAAVLGVRYGLRALGAGGAGGGLRGLLLELAAGGLAYVLSALVVARPIALDFLGIARGFVARKRGGATSSAV